MIRSSPHVGNCPDTAYVYIWLSVKEAIAYVGQTNDACGMVGRAARHVSRGSSLRSRLWDLGYELDEMDNLLLLTYPLPRGWRLADAESSGGEAVERWVQVGIRDLKDEFREFLHLVSHVRPADYFDAREARRLARGVIDDFKEVYDCAVACSRWQGVRRELTRKAACMAHGAYNAEWPPGTVRKSMHADS